MEALLGWKNPKRGLISPDPFIPQLDEMGMMQEVDAWRFTPPAGSSANGRVGYGSQRHSG